MKPFNSIKEVSEWFRKLAYEQHRAPVSVLVDFTDIGKGYQRREIQRGRKLINEWEWICGFPEVTRG